MRGGGWGRQSSLSWFTASGRCEFCVAARDQRAAIGGGEVNVEHLDGGGLVEHFPRREAGGQRLEPGAQRDVQAVLKLVADRAELQIVLEVLERGLDLDELDVELPQLGRISSTDWRAADSALAAAYLS
jgi:hypothetical protein